MLRSSSALVALLLFACGGPAVGPPAGPDDPIVATAGRWTWVDFPGSTCANGQPTGLGISPGAASGDVVVYFQGGGACWDAAGCIGPFPTASHLASGYGAAAFAAEGDLASPAFDRAAGPFKAASFVFVPYCTGDIHAGDAQRVYDYAGLSRAIHHAGGANTALFLRRLAATFPGPRRIFVAGTSAGGYGAQVNYPRFAEAFPQAEIHLLADSAQLVQPAGTRYADWQAAWGWTPPATCATCATELPALAGWLRTTYPAARIALLARTQDATLRAFFGYADAASFDLATRALLADEYPTVAVDPAGRAHAFALPGTGHVLLDDLTTASGGVTLSTWLARWYDGDAAWDGAGP